MSASLLEKPILAYSDEGSFDFATLDKYAGVVDWAYMKYIKINGLISSGARPNQNTIDQWNSVNHQIGVGLGNNNGSIYMPVIVDQWDTATTTGPLMTTRWNQESYSQLYSAYNNFVPNRTDTLENIICRPPAGCVAVAVGQIMKYHNHPNTMTVTNLPDVTTHTITLSTMPNVVNFQNSGSTNAINIARLLENIGKNVAMDYQCNLSTAYLTNARLAFINNYNYSTSNFQYANFNQIISSIQSSKPVLMDGCQNRNLVVVSSPTKIGIFRFTVGKTEYGYQYDICHAWVADGVQKIDRTVVYDNNQTATFTIANHINMNWGWGGTNNGWYDYETWEDISQVVIPETEYIYNQTMINNITPN